MNLAQVIRAIERVAAQQPAVGTIVRNDIYRLNAAPSVRYGVFAWLQGEHRTNPANGMMQFSFTFFYADRLREDKENEIEVQSVGIETLENILRTLNDANIWPGEATITAFNQRFVDECAGVFCNITIEAAKDGLCPVEYGFLVNEGDYNLDYNEDYKVWVWHTRTRDIFIIK